MLVSVLEWLDVFYPNILVLIIQFILSINFMQTLTHWDYCSSKRSCSCQIIYTLTTNNVDGYQPNLNTLQWSNWTDLTVLVKPYQILATIDKTFGQCYKTLAKVSKCCQILPNFLAIFGRSYQILVKNLVTIARYYQNLLDLTRYW